MRRIFTFEVCLEGDWPTDFEKAKRRIARELMEAVSEASAEHDAMPVRVALVANRKHSKGDQS